MSDTTQLLKQMGPTKIGIMIAVALVILGSFVFMSMKLSKPPLVSLFSNLDPSDSGKISAKLEIMGVYYELSSGGAEIMVPRDKVLNARMGLAEDGLPTGRANIGYELFDKSEGIGVSSFINNVNLVRALEGELGRTISAFSHIETARVHLVIPKKDLFSKQKATPTASVVLKMRANQPLESSQIAAISHLVATAVPDLSVKKITIVDTQGRPFKKGAQEDDDIGMMASSKQEFKVRYEKHLKNTIEDLLSRSVGAGKVEAQVNAEIDFDREIIDSEIFDPDGQVVRSVQTVEERENAQDGKSGNVSVANNIPNGGAENSNAGSSSNVERVDEVTNYEVSKTVRKQIKESGTVKKLSIAVLVDGIYEFDEETEIFNYQPRPEESIKQLEDLVKSAIGFDEERGDQVSIINMPFSNEIQGFVEEGKFEWLKRDLGSIVQTIVVGLVVIMIILLVIKPIMNRALEISRNDKNEDDLKDAFSDNSFGDGANLNMNDESSDSANKPLIDLDKIESKINQSSLNKINNIVETHPDESVLILRGWMDGNK